MIKIPYFRGKKTSKISKSGINTVDALLFDDPYVWAGQVSDPNNNSTKITFSFVEDINQQLFSSNYQTPDPNIDNIYSFNEDQRNATGSALEEFSRVANISFSEVKETITQVGTIRFSFTDHPVILISDVGSKELPSR